MPIMITFDGLADVLAFAEAVALRPDIDGKLDTILAALTQISVKEDVMAADLTTLQADVTQNTTVVGSAVALLNGLKSQLDAAIAQLPDPTALQALSAAIESSDIDLANAITANTPAPPAPPPGP